MVQNSFLNENSVLNPKSQNSQAGCVVQGLPYQNAVNETNHNYLQLMTSSLETNSHCIASASDDHVMFDDSQCVNMSQTTNQNFNVLHFNSRRSHLDIGNQENQGAFQRSQIVNDYQGAPLQ